MEAGQEEEIIRTFDINEIKALIPHRYPFLLIDRVLEFVNNKRVIAIKNVTANEEYFSGHFPERPVMPGVIIMEAMAQAGAIMAKASTQGMNQTGTTVFLVGADNFKWRRQVVPGDQLRLEMIFRKKKGPLWILDGTATVDGNVVVSGTLTAMEAP